MSVDEESAFQARSAGALETDSMAMARRRPAIGYVRVAAVSQACSRSALDAQIAGVQAIAAAAGLELGGIVEDSGGSALNMNCPGLLKVLAAAAEGRIDVVIVEDLYRLARDPKDLRGILDMLSSRGIIVMRGDMCCVVRPADGSLGGNLESEPVGPRGDPGRPARR